MVYCLSSTWIERTARRKSIGQVVLFLVVTAIVIWIFAENASYWKVFLFGPPPAGAAQLDAAATAADNYKPIATPYVTVTGGKMLSTGVQEVTTYEGFIHHVSAGYYAMLVGDRVLIVKSGKTPAAMVGGSLGAMPLNLKKELFPEGTDPVVMAQVYPLLLDTNYRESGWVGIFWALLAEADLRLFRVALVDAADGARGSSRGEAGQGVGRPGGDFGRRGAGIADGGEGQKQGLDRDAKLCGEAQTDELRPVPAGEPGVGV